MTVKELIEILQELDQNKNIIFVNVYDDGSEESDNPEINKEKDVYYMYA